MGTGLGQNGQENLTSQEYSQWEEVEMDLRKECVIKGEAAAREMV